MPNLCTSSIMMLFERIEIQHGRLLVFHALAYITASKSGLSESELEDLISLDDKVLDDVYQYHLPPTRRIPPLLWTRIRNDLPNYLSEREADGVNVMNWYHRQFRDTAKERYFKNKNMAMYFHSMIADYYLGIWGGGIPKPFKYTEIQRHRFNLTDKEGIADRKVPDQPLKFFNKEGKVCRYNLRKFGELPFHLVRSRRFTDLYKNVLFNYDWLHAKLSSCPLQAVLADFEDASFNVEEMEAKRELNLVADALRLGGAILTVYPDMLASQLIGRLLPEIGGNPNIKMLLEACDTSGPKDSALIPINHCLHTPGGPLKYSLEGHQFAVFGFCLTSDLRYMVSISTRFITWDLGTSDLTRDVNPGIDGIMQQLVLSSDNKWAGAYTNNNQCVLLNMLSSEFVIINNPFDEEYDPINGVFLLNQSFFVYSKLKWARYDMRGELQETHEFTDINGEEWQLLLMEFTTFSEFTAIFCSGSINETRLRMHTAKDGINTDPLQFHSACIQNKQRNVIYCCKTVENFQVFQLTYTLNEEAGEASWEVTKELPRYENDEKETLLQLKLDQNDRFLMGTCGNGFSLWDFDEENPIKPGEAIYLALPHGVRNISTTLMQSNSLMISSKMDYAIAGVRKNLYVWSLESKLLMKVLDAHFGRIMHLESLTIGNWNCCVTSSIDRSVKVWNINNIFEQVHVIDRLELQIDRISLSDDGELAITVTRSCVGVWELKTGRLLARLADSPLGAIVTHAEITPNGKHIISSETGKIIVWNRVTEQVLYKSDQPGIQQITLLEHGEKFLAVSCPNFNSANQLGNEEQKLTAKAIVRSIPDGEILYKFEYPVKSIPGVSFRMAVVSADCSTITVATIDKTNKDSLSVYNAENGNHLHKVSLRGCGIKECVLQVVSLPHKASQVAVVSSEKGGIIDIKTKKHMRSVPKWDGSCTKDGRFGLYAPTRYILLLS